LEIPSLLKAFLNVNSFEIALQKKFPIEPTNIKYKNKNKN